MFPAFNAHVMNFMVTPLEKTVQTLQTLYKSGQLSIEQFASSMAKLEAKCDKLEMSEIRYEFDCQEAFDKYFEDDTPEHIIEAMNLHLLSVA